MRKFIAFIGAILLALGLAIGILYLQGKTISDLFSNPTDTTDLPLLPQGESPEPERVPEVSLTYEEYMERGDVLFASGAYSAAIFEYVNASQLEPEQLDPFLNLVEAHYNLRNYEKAKISIEAVLQRDPNNAAMRFKQILVMIKLSDFEAAQVLLSNLKASEVINPQNLYYEGILLALFSDHDGATSKLSTARSNSTDSDLNQKIDRLLRAYETFGLAESAEDLYLKQLVAKAFNENEEYEMAIKLLKEVLRERSELRDGWVLLGFAYLNLENYSFAFTAFEKAYTLDTTWSPTQYFLGITHKELGNVDEAIVFFDAALNSGFEPRVVIQNHLADLYFDTQDYQKAVEAYEAVLKVSYQDVNVFVRPVWLYNDYLNDPQSALRLSQAAMEAFPESAMSYNLVGWSYINLEDYKNAEAYLNRAIVLDPKLAAAHQNLGRLYEARVMNDMALASYKKAYELDKNGPIGSLAAEQYNTLLKKNLTQVSDEEGSQN